MYVSPEPVLSAGSDGLPPPAYWLRPGGIGTVGIGGLCGIIGLAASSGFFIMVSLGLVAVGAIVFLVGVRLSKKSRPTSELEAGFALICGALLIVGFVATALWGLGLSADAGDTPATERDASPGAAGDPGIAGRGTDEESLPPLEEELQEVFPESVIYEEDEDYHRHLAADPHGPAPASGQDGDTALDIEIEEYTVTPEGQPDRDIVIRGVAYNHSRQTCLVASLRAYAFDSLGQVVGQGGTVVRELTGRDRESFVITITGIGRRARVQHVEVVPHSTSWEATLDD